jgi:hypothetical protein
MFSFEDMLNFFVEGEGEDEPSLRKQIISKGDKKGEKLSILEIQRGPKWRHCLCSVQKPNHTSTRANSICLEP